MDEYIKRKDIHSALDSHYFTGELSLKETIDSVPSADVRPVRHGRWLIKTIRGDKRTVCSECLLETGTCYEENFCPNCGADMREKS